MAKYSARLEGEIAGIHEATRALRGAMEEMGFDASALAAIPPSSFNTAKDWIKALLMLVRSEALSELGTLNKHSAN